MLGFLPLLKFDIPKRDTRPLICLFTVFVHADNKIILSNDTFIHVDFEWTKQDWTKLNE